LQIFLQTLNLNSNMNNNVNRRMKIQITAIKMTSRIDRLVDVIYTSFFLNQRQI